MNFLLEINRFFHFVGVLFGENVKDLYWEEGSNVLTIVVLCSVLFATAAVLLLVFIFVQWRRKVIAKRKALKALEEAELADKESYELRKIDLKVEDTLKAAPRMSRPIHIDDFSKYFGLLTRNDDETLNEEFISFDAFDENNTCYHGFIPENDSKNRYKNIIPYDHCRVKLNIVNADVNSDYINASFIHGYSKPRVFIATQAPLPQTMVDFWRMIWEKKSTMIVNLTKIEEKGKIKSVMYWPSVRGREKRFGEVIVRRLDKQELENEFFVVYVLELRHTAVEGIKKEVSIFNYVGWPDTGVPDSTAEFIHFTYNVRQQVFNQPPSGPIVCHCSAGTGRTGVFVGVMNSLDRLTRKEDLDILGLVGSLRQQRRKMVFTNTQYKFLHQVMLDIVTSEMYDALRQGSFRSDVEVPGVIENPYASAYENDELESKVTGSEEMVLKGSEEMELKGSEEMELKGSNKLVLEGDDLELKGSDKLVLKVGDEVELNGDDEMDKVSHTLTQV